MKVTALYNTRADIKLLVSYIVAERARKIGARIVALKDPLLLVD